MSSDVFAGLMFTCKDINKLLISWPVLCNEPYEDRNMCVVVCTQPFFRQSKGKHQEWRARACPMIDFTVADGTYCFVDIYFYFNVRKFSYWARTSWWNNFPLIFLLFILLKFNFEKFYLYFLPLLILIFTQTWTSDPYSKCQFDNCWMMYCDMILILNKLKKLKRGKMIWWK